MSNVLSCLIIDVFKGVPSVAPRHLLISCLHEKFDYFKFNGFSIIHPIFFPIFMILKKIFLKYFSEFLKPKINFIYIC